MRIFTHTLESMIAEQIDTEIRFVVASARAGEKELVYFKVESKDELKVSTALLKCLKAMKKQGKIDFFADKNAFDIHTAEASYLINKFPEVTEIINPADCYIIVKI